MASQKIYKNIKKHYKSKLDTEVRFELKFDAGDYEFVDRLPLATFVTKCLVSERLYKTSTCQAWIVLRAQRRTEYFRILKRMSKTPSVIILLLA